MLKIFKVMKRQDWLLMLASVVFITTQVWLDLKMPDYMQQITLLVQTEGSEMREILSAGGRMMICALGSLLSSVVVAVLAGRIATNFGANLRRKMFEKVQSFSMEEIGHFSTASLITRSTNDVMQVQMLIVMGLQALIKAPIMAIWAISKISTKNGAWTSATALAVGILLLLVIVCVLLALPRFKKMQKLIDNLNRVTRENLTGLRVVRAYNAEEYQEDKFDKANCELMRTNLYANHVMAFMLPGIQLVNSGLTLAIYWIGAALINSAGMMEKASLFSDMVIFSSYAMQVVMSFMMLVMIVIILPRASVAAKRILEVLDTKVAIQNGTRSEGCAIHKGLVEFRNVSFRYPDSEEYVLKNISFTASKGETIAFIGTTGCGKSTVVNLIPRFYDATEGEVLVDGINVREYDQRALRNKIGYVAQKAMLFSGTVRSNIAYGNNGCRGFLDSDLVEAAYTAQAAEFVEKMDGGYDAHIAQSGSNLSGGQRQRLSIARAICRRPEIFIFDDSFSALDYKTDRTLREALRKDCADATKLIVAQRIGTIRDADQIIVLNDGCIAGKGTHAELMHSCEVYRQIARSQLSEEELA